MARTQIAVIKIVHSCFATFILHFKTTLHHINSSTHSLGSYFLVLVFALVRC